MSKLSCTCVRVITPKLRPVFFTATRLYSQAASDAGAAESTGTAEPNSPADKKQKDKLRRTVKKHLSHSDDPFVIAQHVETILRKDMYDEALLLTQQASKDKNVVVAWNHLIGYQLEKQRLKGAMKLYNDMKKRGQLPNVQTFTVIFRGCSRSQHPKLAVAEAVKLYNVLLADRRLQPNSIHLNAVLNVCARAGDLDSLFLVANTLNDSTRAATPYTYTTIFNALRHHALNDTTIASDRGNNVSSEQNTANLQKTVDRARSIWVEVVEKWQTGKLVVDEELVCSMGRVQLLSPRRDQKRQVLDLLQQTMNVPNLSLSASDAEPPSTPPAAQSGFVKPGRNTLALILTTLASSKLTSVGMKYWSLLTTQFNVSPDADNHIRLLGMLKVAKASANSSMAISSLPDPASMGSKPYRIAMETCVRDNINPNVMENATSILQSMLVALKVPDLHTLRLYLRVALVSHHSFRKLPDEKGKRAYGTQLTSALGHLWEPYKSTHYHYFKATPTPPSKTEQAILYNNKREVIALARHMFSAFNKVINEKMLPDQELKDLRKVGAKINKEIVRFYEDREDIEPKLRKSGAASSSSSFSSDHRRKLNSGSTRRPASHETDQTNSRDSSDPSLADFEDEFINSSDLRQGGDFVWKTDRVPKDALAHHSS